NDVVVVEGCAVQGRVVGVGDHEGVVALGRAVTQGLREFGGRGRGVSGGRRWRVDLAGGEILFDVLRVDDDRCDRDGLGECAAGGGYVVGAGGEREGITAAGEGGGREERVVGEAAGGEGYAAQAFAWSVEVVGGDRV